MNIKQFEVPGLAQYSYIISSGNAALVVDAMRDFDRYTAYASEHGLTITHIVETHIHADFAAGSAPLAEATGAELALSAYDKDELYSYAMPHRRLKSGDFIEFGMLKLQALHTPGHTPEHLSFLLFDLERSAAEPVAIFTGDFLFAGSLGRPDLLGEDAKQSLAHELYRSVHERIADLHDSVQVYPGHGAGSLCGSGMSDQTSSTLGYERATQPFFKLSEADFVQQILASVPPMPTYYPRMKKLNAAGAPSVASLPGGTGILAMEAAELQTRADVVFIDLRHPEAFGGAHIEGAINIGAGQNLSLWAGWLLDAEKSIVLISEVDDDEASRRALVRVGIDRILGHLAGGISTWIDAGYDFVGTQQVSARRVEDLREAVRILDVRSDSEWNSGHIPGADHIMLGDLPHRVASIPQDRPIVTVCGSGYRSSIAASLLQRSGIKNVSSMGGGMAAWNQQQLPLERS